MAVNMYETLLLLPLFQGISREDMTKILEKVKFHFIQYKAGDTIVQSGETSDKLFFILNGEIESHYQPQKDFTFIEYIRAPHVIEPYSLFGLNVSYSASYIAHTKIDAVSINKSFIIEELFSYEIFRFNYVNLISNRAQVLYKRLWIAIPEHIEHKIILFIGLHSERPQGKKVLKIKMEDLARYANDTRLNVSKALNNLQERNLVILRRKEVIIPELETLLNSIK